MAKIVNKAKRTARLVAAMERASGKSQAVAAQAAGVSHTTVWRWEVGGDAEYQRHYGAAVRRLMREVWSEAILTLRAALRDEDPRVRVSAAAVILRSVEAVEVRQETRELTARVDALEGTLEGGEASYRRGELSV